MTARRIWSTVGFALALLLAGCGDDDSADVGPSDQASSDDSAETDDGSETESSGDDGEDSGETADSGDEGSGGGGAPGGTLVVGDETITLDSARCFLQEQDVAGSDGKILFTAQGFGTNAAGEDLVLDVSRYDEDSLFTGDDIIVDIGDPFSEDAISLLAGGDIGTVQLDGSTLSAGSLTFRDDTGAEQPGSFTLSC